jgi:hypothetical protein
LTFYLTNDVNTERYHHYYHIFRKFPQSLIYFMPYSRAEMITKTLAALAAITVAMALAVVPALTNQVFAQDCPGCNGQGHNVDATNRGGHEKDPDSPAAKCVTIFAGQSEHEKFSTDDEKCK